MSEIRKIGFLFDMDGVLVDSVGFNWQAYNSVLLADYGFTVPDDEIHKFMGMEMAKQVALLSGAYGCNIDLASFKERTNAIKECNQHSLKAKRGAEVCLRMLREGGVLLAVGTSNTAKCARARLTQIGLLDFFDVIVTESDVKAHKPDPETYIVAAQKLGLEPRDCTVVEDAPAGLASGLAAGSRVIGVRTPYVKEDALNVADLVVNDLDEITLKYALG